MSLQLEDFLITGRTFEEYLAFFDLDVADLSAKRVLDCPSGASSFVAEAKKLQIDAKGCDKLYEYPIEDICTQGEKSIEIIYKDTSWMQRHNFAFYNSIENHRNFRESALKFFCEDYNAQDYSFALLPHLPYENKSFDLLLSSHLLFVYDERLDLEFHINAIEEMLRVAKEVRIFPLVDYRNSHVAEERNFSPLVYEVLQHFPAEILEVEFEFQRGANHMMRITS